MQQSPLIELNPSNVTLNASFLPTGGPGAAGWFKVDELFASVICAAWTGTPQGNFFLEGTPNAPWNRSTGAAIAVPTNRIFTLSGSTVAAGGAAGQNAWERITQSGFPYIRLNYTFAASTGTLVYVCQTGITLTDT